MALGSSIYCTTYPIRSQVPLTFVTNAIALVSTGLRGSFSSLTGMTVPPSISFLLKPVSLDIHVALKYKYT